MLCIDCAENQRRGSHGGRSAAALRCVSTATQIQQRMAPPPPPRWFRGSSSVALRWCKRHLRMYIHRALPPVAPTPEGSAPGASVVPPPPLLRARGRGGVDAEEGDEGAGGAARGRRPRPPQEGRAGRHRRRPQRAGGRRPRGPSQPSPPPPCPTTVWRGGLSLFTCCPRTFPRCASTGGGASDTCRKRAA